MSSAPAPSVAQNASEALKNVSEKVGDMSKKIMDSPSLMIASIFIIFLLVFVIVYVYVKFKSRVKYFTAVNKPLYLYEMESTVLASQAALPKQSNGPVYTYAFWLYVNNLVNTGNTDYKLLWRRGNNPIVYMEPNASTIHIKILNGRGMSNGAISSSLDLNASLHANKCDFIHLTIDYLPLQRWAHLVVCADADHVVLYVDGDIYKVVYLSTEKATCHVTNGNGSGSSIATSVSLSGVASSTGDLVSGHADKFKTPDAIITRLAFFDNSITLQDVQGLYSQGPVSNSALSKLGIPVYGVRNPFYRIDKVAVNDKST